MKKKDLIRVIRKLVQEEVKKFLHDVETQNCCGLFLAQNYGIANKEDFEVNIPNLLSKTYFDEMKILNTNLKN